MLYHLLAPFGGQAALLGDELTENHVDLTGHVGGVTAYVEVRLLFDEVEDEGSVFTKLVLDVNLLVGLAGEGGDDLERVSELCSESLKAG